MASSPPLTTSPLCSPITSPTCLVDMKRANAAVLSFFKDVLAISPKMIAPALMPMPSQVGKKGKIRQKEQDSELISRANKVCTIIIIIEIWLTGYKSASQHHPLRVGGKIHKVTCSCHAYKMKEKCTGQSSKSETGRLERHLQSQTNSRRAQTAWFDGYGHTGLPLVGQRGGWRCLQRQGLTRRTTLQHEI